MSQYAFYLAKKQNNPYCRYLVDPKASEQHNGFELERLFGIKQEDSIGNRILTKAYLKVLYGTRAGRLLYKVGFRIIKENQNYDYNESLLKRGGWGVNFYRGGWHSEKYFYHIRFKVIDAFKITNSNLNESTRLYSDMIKGERNAVSIHVRRGDYLKKPWGIYDFSHVATEDYYDKAIRFVRSRLDSNSISFYVFSDDIEWCKEHFGTDGFIYIDCNHGNDSWQDLFLMTLCSWHINANSTFSWWGAWLSGTPNNTIVPERFLRNIETKDIYPDGWIKIHK